jgi:hypothetical protein
MVKYDRTGKVTDGKNTERAHYKDYKHTHRECVILIDFWTKASQFYLTRALPVWLF